MHDQIEKSIEIKAPLSKVWNAIADYHQFGKWFCVMVENSFVPGQVSKGTLTYPGYENIPWKITVQKIEPEQLFSFTWHPYAIDVKKDYSHEIPTLVEFKLKPISNGTLLLLTESGFNKIPSSRQEEAYQKNAHGWEEQMKNIQTYIEKNSSL